jgi:hypothetical protein
MSDEVDEVLDQYGVKGLDPSMLEGALKCPPSVDDAVSVSDTRASQAAFRDVVAKKIKEASDPTEESPNVIPEPEAVTSLPELAAKVGISIPEASDIRKAVTNPAANDKLVESIRRDDSTLTILNTVMEEIAEEAAFIKAWRNQNWDGEKDISEATLSRIKMLSELVKSISEREKLKREKAVGKVDFHSENFQSVLKYFMSIIVGTFKKVQIPQQFEDIFITQLAKDFDGFEKKAEKIYYGKSTK